MVEDNSPQLITGIRPERDKGPSINFSSGSKVRSLLLTHYFPYIFHKSPPPPNLDRFLDEDRLCLENQLENHFVRQPSMLTYPLPSFHINHTSRYIVDNN